MSDSRSPSLFTIAAVTVATGVLAYAVYFDYKRRHDADFRKNLKKEKKRIQKKTSKESVAQGASSSISDDALRAALEEVKKDEVPTSPEEKEHYFMSQVSMGEQLSVQGENFALPAALAFYRALRVYPSPVELIVIYQKTVPENIFQVIIRLTDLDVKGRVEGYYHEFPPAQYNVKVEMRELPEGGSRKVLVAAKDFTAGDVIYKETPVVTALDADLQAAGTHCFHCLQLIEDQDSAVKLTEEISVYPSTYCSETCLLKSKAQSTSLLFTSESPLPSDIPSEVPGDASGAKRKDAQTKLAEYLKKEGRAVPELSSRFVARQVAIETQKLVASVSKNAPEPLVDEFAGSDIKDYALADHLERLRYLELNPNSEEANILTEVLECALPGLKQFIPEERHTIISGKMAYNQYGVCYNGGRDDKPKSTVPPEDAERTRTPYGTQRQIGSAFYILSSYLQHSCQPTAQPSFGSENSELTLLATKDINKGEELTVAWVDVTQKPDESVAECRRRRRYELARGWRFACPCERCAEEAKNLTEAEKTVAAEEEPKKDESVVEDVTKHEGAGEHEATGAEDIDT